MVSCSAMINERRSRHRWRRRQTSLDDRRLLFLQFSTHSKDGAVFHTYCINYTNALTYLEKLRQNPEFSEFERVCTISINSWISCDRFYSSPIYLFTFYFRTDFFSSNVSLVDKFCLAFMIALVIACTYFDLIIYCCFESFTQMKVR